jgi:hypothetical protein
MHNKPDPLNPDSEQQLFEALSMDPDDLKALNYIRYYVRIIRDKEQNESKSIKE